MIKKRDRAFEEYLKDIHADDYIGTDDDMPDAFEAWLTDLQVDDIVSYADEWHDGMKKPYQTFNEFLKKHHSTIFQDSGPEKADGFNQRFKTRNIDEIIMLAGDYGVSLTS